MKREKTNDFGGGMKASTPVARLVWICRTTLKTLGKKLDHCLVRCLRQLGWSRFQKKQSILELQQMMPNELRHGVSDGAMFYALYAAPVKIWPQNARREETARG